MDQGAPEENQQNPIHGNEDDLSSLKSSSLVDRHSSADFLPLLSTFHIPHSIECRTGMQQFLRDLLPRRPFSRYRSGHAYRAFAECLSERVYALQHWGSFVSGVSLRYPYSCWTRHEIRKETRNINRQGKEIWSAWANQYSP